MKEKQSTYRSYIWQHRLISFFRNIDFPGFRRISLLLPKCLLPSAAKVGEHILKIPSGLLLHIDPSKDQGVERSLYETGTYEKGTLNFMENFLTKGQTFVDVGANIGLMSITAKKQVGDTGDVWAFEANPKTFELLEKNIELNHMKGIQCFECGLGDKKEKLTLYDNWSINRGAASTVVKGERAKEVEISILTFDEIASAHSISVDMMKVDVEGMEWEVLEGAQKTIQQNRPILIVEFSDTREKGRSREELYTKLTNFADYNIYKLSGGKERTSKLVAISQFSDLPVDDNVFCIPVEKMKK